MFKNSYFIIAMAMLSLLSLSLPITSCTRTTQVVDELGRVVHSDEPPTSIPYIFPSYYQAVELLPIDLENAYYTGYGNIAGAETLYNGKAFIFKNVLVDAWMIREIDKGWIWADLIKCPIVNLNEAKRFHPGDRIDIVGISMGRDLKQSPGLVFKDVIVMQAGSVQIPAPGSSSTFSSGGY